MQQNSNFNLLLLIPHFVTHLDNLTKIYNNINLEIKLYTINITDYIIHDLKINQHNNKIHCIKCRRFVNKS